MNRSFALALLIVSPACLAADWEYVAATGASNVYVDLESLKQRDNGTKSAWYLFDHLDTRYDIDAARVYKSSRQLIEIECATGRLTWTRIETYAGPLASGAKVGARNIDNQAAAFMESVHSTAREAMVRAVCEG